jgi:DNA-binding NarL/FixJ family response regulator
MIKGRRSGKSDRTEEMKDLEKHTLTKAEIEIVKLVELNFSNKEIAKTLLLSEKTVKCHLTNIYAKLSIKSRYQLIVYVKRLENRYKSQS